MSRNKKTANKYDSQKNLDRKNNSSKFRSKKVEIDVDKDDINIADLKGNKYTKKGTNDPSWYSHNAQLLKDAASFPFALPLGTEVDMKYGQPSGITISNGNQSIAGLAVMEFMPTIGVAQGSSADPINVCANANYTFIRRNLSTYANYDAPDLMTYLLAMDSAYMIYATMVRIYGLMQASYVYNRYLPREIVRALGFSYDNLILNLADFRAQINAYAYKLAQFCVPSDMDYYKRHLWMCTNIFEDSSTVKAQIYAYKLNGFYKYAEQTDGPAKLIYTPLVNYTSSSTQQITYEQVINILNDAILPLMESQDCIAMSGDIMKSWGTAKIYTVSPIAENYLTMPVMSYEVLSQFENATLLGEPLTVTDTVNNVVYSPDITQRTDLDFGGVGLQQNLAFTGIPDDASTNQIQGNILKSRFMLNMHKNDVTPDDVMVATRLSNIVQVVGQATVSSSPVGYYTLGSVGSEVGLTIALWSFSRISNKWQSSKVANVETVNYITASTSWGYPMLSWISQFDWFPYVLVAYVDNSTNISVYRIQDVDNYTLMDYNDLRMLHETAMLSLFDSPAMHNMANAAK
nr:capsid protein [Rat picobirnavirus]